MRNIVLMVMCCFMLSNFSVGAQDNSIGSKDRRFFFGFGFTIGFFNPDHINRYIESWYEDKNFDESDNVEFSELRGNLGGHINLGCKFSDRYELYFTLEGSIAVKHINWDSGFGSSESFSFTRLSPGLAGNGIFPFSDKGKVSFLIGMGLYYHILKFEKYECLTPGFMGKIGFNFNISDNRLNTQIFVAYDYAKGKDKGFSLDYSGVRVGINLNF